MDIRIFNQIVSGRPVVADVGDLLTQLRAAGTVEAEVISRLPDSLLLQTRLGRILTHDRHHFQPGDRLELRLEGDRERPVLKASDAAPRPLTLDANRNPRLAELLPANRAVLASIARVLAESTLIRIADQLLTLPVRIERPREQLLSLLYQPRQQAVEVEPVERKSLYLAMLRHLLPRHAEPRAADLVRFFRLVVETAVPADGRAARAGGELANPGATATRANLPASTVLNAARPQRASELLRPPPLPAAIRAALRVARFSPPVALSRAREFPQAGPSRPGLVQHLPALIAPSSRTQPRVADFAGKHLPGVAPAAKFSPPAASTPSRTAAPSAHPSLPASRLQIDLTRLLAQTPAQPPRTAARGAQTPPGSHQSAVPGPAANPQTATRSRGPTAPGAPAASAQTATGTSPPGAAAATAPSSALASLLAALPTLQQLDASTLRRWFEDLGFARPANPASATATGGLLQSLRSLNDSATLMRELLQLATPETRIRADAKLPKADLPPAELLLPWVRDGVKLVEQALSQNLLQRASLGLQQEAQQPTSLSFALPVLDGQQVKPLQIELAQKQAARDASTGAWEIRINFDFSGLGPITCHVVLEGLAVAASFYCAHDQSRDRIEQALPELRQQLDAAGFVAGELHGFVAAAETTTGDRAYRIDDALIDVEA